MKSRSSWGFTRASWAMLLSGRCLVFHGTDVVAFRVLEANQGSHGRDGGFRDGDAPGVALPRGDDGVEVVHRDRGLEAVQAGSGARLLTPVHEALDARVRLVAGVDQVEAGRPPGLEPPTEHRLVEGARSVDVVHMDREGSEVVCHGARLSLMVGPPQLR